MLKSFQDAPAKVGRIAILLPDLRPGGVEKMRINMARLWLDQGHTVDFVVLRKEGALLPFLPAGAGIVDLGAARYRSATGPLVRYLRRIKPDVILVAMWPLTVLAVVAARLANYKKRVVLSDHSLLSESYRGWGGLHRLVLRMTMAAAYRLADERIAVSHGVAADLALLSGIPRRLFQVIHNPAATGVAASAALGSPPELENITGPIILTVGTLKAVKDHAMLIEAFSRLPRHMNATLCILGEGQLRPYLEDLVESKGLGGHVLLPGFRSNTAPWYQRAELFVLSSRHEGFGNVIVEALEQGLPVVSTDCPSGPREILEDGRFGRMVPVGDADAFCSAILAALGERTDRELLKERARHFSVGKISEEYLAAMFPKPLIGPSP